MATPCDKPGETPFNWVQSHPLMPAEVAQHFRFDHADAGPRDGRARALGGKPEPVDQQRAFAAQGEAGVAVILGHLKRRLGL